jgi:plasmid maintenance system antidote protein VapI
MYEEKYSAKKPSLLLLDNTITPTTYIDCVLDTMQEKRSYLNIHLIPQVFMLYNQQNYNEKHPGLTIDIMDMADVTSVMKGMGSPIPNISHNIAATKTETNPFVNGTSLLTAHQILRICNLYQMDVDFLHSTQKNITTTTTTTTTCDDKIMDKINNKYQDASSKSLMTS